MQVEDQVREVVTPLLADLSVNLWDVELKGSRLRVLVDTNQGIDTKTLGLVSRVLSSELASSNSVPDNYILEVSSPGLDKPLNRLEHFKSCLGSEITVKLKTPLPTSSPPSDAPTDSVQASEVQTKIAAAKKGEQWRVSGVLFSAEEEFIEIQDKERAGEIVKIPHTDIKKAQSVFVWEEGGS